MEEGQQLPRSCRQSLRGHVGVVDRNWTSEPNDMSFAFVAPVNYWDKHIDSHGDLGAGSEQDKQRGLPANLQFPISVFQYIGPVTRNHRTRFVLIFRAPWHRRQHTWARYLGRRYQQHAFPESGPQPA